jgi:phage-related protein
VSAPEAPAETEAQQILAGLRDLGSKLDKHTDALNNVGVNVQWIIDNVQGLFQMFHNPAFGGLLGSMLSGGMPGMGNLADMADDLNDVSRETDSGEKK